MATLSRRHSHFKNLTIVPRGTDYNPARPLRMCRLPLTVFTDKSRPPLPIRPSRLLGPQRPLLCEIVSGRSLSSDPFTELNFTSVLRLVGTSRSMEPFTVVIFSVPSQSARPIRTLTEPFT